MSLYNSRYLYFTPRNISLLAAAECFIARKSLRWRMGNHVHWLHLPVGMDVPSLMEDNRLIYRRLYWCYLCSLLSYTQRDRVIDLRALARFTKKSKNINSSRPTCLVSPNILRVRSSEPLEFSTWINVTFVFKCFTDF